jgi:hypothetical protein
MAIYPIGPKPATPHTCQFCEQNALDPIFMSRADCPTIVFCRVECMIRYLLHLAIGAAQFYDRQRQ